MTFNKYLLTGVLYLSPVPAAFACAFHGVPEVQLEGMYPGSLSVAVALRSAADNGVIDAAVLEAPSKGTARYNDSLHLLQTFGATLAASTSAANLPTSFSLGFVESHLWTRYSQSEKKIHVNVHTDGPANGEAVILTGEPVLAELLAGRLSVDRALTDGMILIDANENDKTAIRQALIATSMTDKISRR